MGETELVIQPLKLETWSLLGLHSSPLCSKFIQLLSFISSASLPLLLKPIFHFSFPLFSSSFRESILCNQGCLAILMTLCLFVCNRPRSPSTHLPHNQQSNGGFLEGKTPQCFSTAEKRGERPPMI